VLACAAPFILGVLFLLAARLVGAISIAPPGPLPAVAVAPHARGVAILVAAVLITVCAFAVLRPTVLRFAAGRGPRRRILAEQQEGIVAAVLLIMCAVTLAIWLTNPFAALLAVPALHLWLAAISPDLHLRRALRIGLLALGLLPVAAVVLYYGSVLGYDPVQVAWSAVLLVVGHVVGLLAVLEWSLFLGCAVVVGGVLALATREPHAEAVPVTVRGPVSYAGPGSLGGTESALRR
jgi:hypothetical protein